MPTETQLPKILGKCPLNEAIFEIRFEPNVPAAALFGIFYAEIRSKFPDVESLPIVQLPEALRDQDRNLQFLPHHRFRNQENVLIQIGPRVLSVNAVNEYIGWARFKENILETLATLKKLEITSKVSRLGLRYSNLFNEPVLDKINIELSKGGVPITNRETNIRTVYDEGNGYKIVLQISGDVTISPTDVEPYIGSLIDVDIILSGEDLPVLQDGEALIEKAHQMEKKTFFSLLKRDFLESLEPSYE